MLDHVCNDVLLRILLLARIPEGKAINRRCRLKFISAFYNLAPVCFKFYKIIRKYMESLHLKLMRSDFESRKSYKKWKNRKYNVPFSFFGSHVYEVIMYPLHEARLWANVESRCLGVKKCIIQRKREDTVMLRWIIVKCDKRNEKYLAIDIAKSRGLYWKIVYTPCHLTNYHSRHKEWKLVDKCNGCIYCTSRVKQYGVMIADRPFRADPEAYKLALECGCAAREKLCLPLCEYQVGGSSLLKYIN